MNPTSEARPAPKCPYCDVQPCPIAMSVLSFGHGAIAGVFTCGGCDKILSVAPLPQVEQDFLPRQQSALIVPGVGRHA